MAYVDTQPGQKLFYKMAGDGKLALLFVHGWLGSHAWWCEQVAFFSQQYTAIAMDLPGHGGSDGQQGAWTAEGYASAIQAVVRHSGAARVVLVAHSMAGAYALLASRGQPAIRAVVLVDTLKNLDQLMSHEDAQAGILKLYRDDFSNAVRNVLPAYLYAEATPASVKSRLQAEFLAVDAGHAVTVIEPLYKMDIRSAARAVQVPVRAIGNGVGGANAEANRRYLADYQAREMAGAGHYPMIERAQEFNLLLAAVLDDLSQRG